MELSVVILLIAFIYYWLGSIRAKEIATMHAKLYCKNISLEFLDDTVLIKKLRLCRNTKGHLSFYREYEFEFSSTGDYRYKGQVRLLSNNLIDIKMEPYKFNDI